MAPGARGGVRRIVIGGGMAANVYPIFQDGERARSWIACGERWFENDDPFVLLNIQMLGHAEPPILALEAQLATLPAGEAEDIGLLRSAILTQCSALSIYWLFGLYEVLRTLKKVAPKRFVALHGLFHEVSVARMPLAKHSVKGAPGYNNRWHYPTSMWDPLTGRVGWQVFDPLAEKMIGVARTDVADRFLAITG